MLLRGLYHIKLVCIYEKWKNKNEHFPFNFIFYSTFIVPKPSEDDEEVDPEDAPKVIDERKTP